MRDSARIAATPAEYQDQQREERRRTLAALLAELRRARESGAEWYRWIADGQPPLSPEAYARTNPGGGRRARPPQQSSLA